MINDAKHIEEYKHKNHKDENILYKHKIYIVIINKGNIIKTISNQIIIL